MAITIMVAGNETSTNLIGNTVVELLSSTIPSSTVWSKTRLCYPMPFKKQTGSRRRFSSRFGKTTEEAEIAGARIPKGAIVVLHFAVSANRDPRHFDNPDEFRIDRPLGKNLSFGHGIHFCLRAHLAGQEVRTAVRQLLPSLNPCDSPIILSSRIRACCSTVGGKWN